MASTNQSPQYKKAEAKFLQAHTNEEKLSWLEEMIRECPKHKSSEKMLANLKTRYIKLKEKIEAKKKTSKSSGKPGIKKEEMQAVIIGKSNSGKSSLLSLLTKASPKISPIMFTTRIPEVGMMDYTGTQVQLIEIPSVESEFYDKGLANTSDLMLILVNKLEDIEEIKKKVGNSLGKHIIIFNKIGEGDIRKIEATLKSKRYNFSIINTKTKEGIGNLKDKIFGSFGRLRIYTKEPYKEKSERPFILSPGATVRDVAEKIIKGFSSKIKETKIWGPSSKFPGQIVGLSHKLKDLDVVEFKTR